MTIDSLQAEINENRRTLRGLPVTSSIHKRLSQRNTILGAMVAAIKDKKDPIGKGVSPHYFANYVFWSCSAGRSLSLD